MNLSPAAKTLPVARFNLPVEKSVLSAAVADPAKDRLRAHLLDAKSKLQSALGVVSEGFDGEEDIVKTSGTVVTLAEKVYNELETKYQSAQTGGKKGRMTDGTV